MGRVVQPRVTKLQNLRLSVLVFRDRKRRLDVGGAVFMWLFAVAAFKKSNLVTNFVEANFIHEGVHQQESSAGDSI